MDESGNYKEESFIIPASDAKGHSVRQGFRCTPGHDRQMNIILSSRRFPYKTKPDLLRHAMDRHLKWLLTLDSSLPSVMTQIGIITEILKDEEFHQEFRRIFDRMGDAVANYMSQGSNTEAQRIILQVIAQVKKMPEGYWRDRYLTEIKQRYGHLLQGIKASLLPEKEE